MRKGSKLEYTNNVLGDKNNATNDSCNQLPQTSETNFVIASLFGLEVISICGVIHLVKNRKENGSC